MPNLIKISDVEIFAGLKILLTFVASNLIKVLVMDKEIEAGDVVFFPSDKQSKSLMTVGSIENGIAKCFWSTGTEVKTADIPVVALNKL